MAVPGVKPQFFLNVVTEYDNSLDRLPFIRSDGGGGWIDSRISPFNALKNVTANSLANGSILEDRDLVITSDGAIIDATISATVPPNLTFRFSNGLTVVDFTVPKQVTLTAGSETVEVENFLYFLKTDPTTLIASSVNFPAVEHARIGRITVLSATRVQADGVLKQHDYTDHTEDTANNGHVQHINDYIREQFATWKSGVAQTITGSGTGNVTYAVTSGVVKQLHDQAFPAIVNPADIIVINDSGIPFHKITNLGGEILEDSTGASLTGKHYVLVSWAVISEAGSGQSKLFINVPSGSYNTQSQAETDIDKTANFSIPIGFTGVGFLVQKFVMQNAGDATFTVNSTEDLRGQKPPVAAGSSSAQATQFSDAQYAIFNNADNTKVVVRDASNITTGTTRTVTEANRDLNLATPIFDSVTIDNIVIDAGAITTGPSEDLNLEPGLGGVTRTTKALIVGNIGISGNIITSQDVSGDVEIQTLSNGDVNLSPNGTGVINILKDMFATTINASEIIISAKGNVGLGDIKGFVPSYNTTTSIVLSPGFLEANGSYYERTTPQTHSLTSLASAFDFHYIYIDDSASTSPTATIIDSTTEPTFSNSKLGWYNGNDRCIGVVASRSGVSTILYFEEMAVSQKNIRHEYGRRSLGQLALNVNPDDTWQTPNVAESSTKCPVTSIEAHFELLCFDTSSTCTGELTTQEMAAAIDEASHVQIGFNSLYTTPWIMLHTSRNVRMKGNNNDDNTFSLYIGGYGFSR